MVLVGTMPCCHEAAKRHAAPSLPLRVENLTPPIPGAEPSRLDVKSVPGGLQVNMIEGLACDGSWIWRAHRTAQNAIVVQLTDDNHSSTRISCASMVHQKVTVSGLSAGSYEVHVALPTGYGAVDRQITVER